MARLIFGCGYLGLRVSQRWRDAQDEVFVVTRSKTRAAALADEGFSPIVADVTQPKSLASLPAVRTVLYAIGYDPAASADFREVYVGGLQSVLEALPPQTEKLIYISTTGVYGQTDGQSVDEDSARRPVRERARACLEAETLLDAHPFGQRTIKLRLAGLYGPGRIPNAEAIRGGRPISVPPNGFLNLIHVDDAVEVVLAAETLASPPRTYNVSDGHPVERRHYYEELARQLSAPTPRFTLPADESAAAVRASTDKCVSNARMLAELHVALRYPTYRQGLAAIVAAERSDAP
jgi:nucleoside-diphosphate-sugar epimerase